jgi:hypothetical protein
VLDPFVAPPAEDPYWEAVRQRRGYGYTLPTEAVPSSASEAFLNRLADALELPHFAFGAATTTRSFFGKCGFGKSFIEGIEHRISYSQPHQVTIYTSPTTVYQLFVLDSSTLDTIYALS